MTREKSSKRISTRFGSSLLAVMGFAFISLIVSICLSFIQNPNDMQKELFILCNTTWKILTGAIAGLIGGKRL
jgi:hypothetical protein